jgi:organic hydroperoxide reductase OsmC/OhrA
MKVSAHIVNSQGSHKITLTTNEHSHSIVIQPKPSGYGSSANGGELLFLALATCYCNDLYREAAQRNIRVDRVEVTVDGEFGAEGEPAKNVVYSAKVTAHASDEEILDLIWHTDTVAEIQNTLRVQTPVILSQVEAISV